MVTDHSPSPAQPARRRAMDLLACLALPAVILAPWTLALAMQAGALSGADNAGALASWDNLPALAACRPDAAQLERDLRESPYMCRFERLSVRDMMGPGLEPRPEDWLEYRAEINRRAAADVAAGK